MPDSGARVARRHPPGSFPGELIDAVLGLSWLFSGGFRRAHDLLATRLDPLEVWTAGRGRLLSWGLDPAWVGAYLQARGRVPLGRLECALDGSDLHVLPMGRPGYPPELLQLARPPAGLFLAGDLDALSTALGRPRITIVGSRNPDAYGLSCASAFAHACAEAGITVVSGMALGIDGRAHTAALEAGGPSVAVLGSGAESAYPRRHRSMYERLVKSGGVLSELPPGTVPARWTFPWRNRLLAALGDAVLVIQAGKKSGALSTVDHALHLGREVFVVPGKVRNSAHAGCNLLLYEGARVALDPDTLVEDYFALTRISREQRQPPGPRPRVSLVSAGSSLSAVERLVFFALQRGPASVEMLAQTTGCGVSEVAAACTVLEIEGRCSRTGSGVYELTS